MLYEGICSADLAAPCVARDDLLWGFLDLGVLMGEGFLSLGWGGRREAARYMKSILDCHTFYVTIGRLLCCHLHMS
jgi:hypothetical protein